jgi:hypothetical protein
MQPAKGEIMQPLLSKHFCCREALCPCRRGACCDKNPTLTPFRAGWNFAPGWPVLSAPDTSFIHMASRPFQTAEIDAYFRQVSPLFLGSLGSKLLSQARGIHTANLSSRCFLFSQSGMQRAKSR